MATRKASVPVAGRRPMPVDTHEFLAELGRLCAKGVEDAREENRRLGLPNVEARDGHVVHVMPDGEVRIIRPL